MNFIARLSPNALLRTLIVAPLVLALLYFGALAANRYVSEAVVVVRQANQSGTGSGLPGAALLLAGINPSSREDTMYLRQYIHSLALLKRLDERLKLREHFAQRAGLDVFCRLYSFFPQEWFLQYYRDRVELLLDDETGLLKVRVQGFEPSYAQQLNQAILDESEQFINTLSHRVAREQMQFAEGELQRAGERLQDSKRKLLAFQGNNQLLDPLVQAQATGTLTAEMQAMQSRAEADLKQALTYLNEDAYQVKALHGQIEALRAQIEVERKKATSGPTNGRQINAQAAQFQDLKLQAGFAEDAYKLALTAVENARIEASRKIKTVSVIEPPSLPEMAEYPRRLYSLLTLAIVCLLLYGVARLAVATVRDHQD